MATNTDAFDGIVTKTMNEAIETLLSLKILQKVFKSVLFAAYFNLHFCFRSDLRIVTEAIQSKSLNNLIMVS